MREIKFRAKSGTQWRYGDLYHNERGELVIYEPLTKGKTLDGAAVLGWRLVVDPKTVGQFTGVLDCEGREIYDGDVVTLGDDPTPSAVRWDNELACYIIVKTLILGHVYKYVRVIGNLHDNPDLLEVEHD